MSIAFAWRLTLYLAVTATAPTMGCSARPGPRLLTATPPRATAVHEVAAATPLLPTENIRPTQLERGEQSSIALVQIRDREAPHVHTRYDLAVTLASGSGTLWLNGTPLSMHAGDVAFIPRGTPHFFVNRGSQPATALVVFSPPFSGPDQQPAP